MEIDEDDDFYAPEEPQVSPAQPTTTSPSGPEPTAPTAPSAGAKTDPNEELEEGEEEDEGGEMDEDDDSVGALPFAPICGLSVATNITLRRTLTSSSTAKIAQAPHLHRTADNPSAVG